MHLLLLVQEFRGKVTVLLASRLQIASFAESNQKLDGGTGYAAARAFLGPLDEKLGSLETCLDFGSFIDYPS